MFSIIIYKKEGNKQQLSYINNFPTFEDAIKGLDELDLNFTNAEIKKGELEFFAKLENGVIVRIENYKK